VITLADGSVIDDELAVADAHPAGARPFDRDAYAGKFRTLSDGTVAPADQDRFLTTAEHLAELGAPDLGGLFPAVDIDAVASYDAQLPKGLF
jgi:2-methylcitrate dehydratase